MSPAEEVTHRERWAALSSSDKWALIALGLVRTDPSTGIAMVDVDGAIEHLRAATRKLESLRRVEAVEDPDLRELVGQLEETARRVDLQRACGVPRESVRLPSTRREARP